MQTADFVKFIKDPQLLKANDVAELQRLTFDFPYFQSAHLLLSMASKMWDPSVFQLSLKKTALLAANRSHLFNLIQKIEKEGTQVTKVEPPPVETVIKPAEVTIKQELDILKSAEVAVEEINQIQLQRKEQTLKNEPVTDKSFLEKEIGKEVVGSIVDKEILNPGTTETKNIEPEKEPETFTAWLGYLKKQSETDESLAVKSEEVSKTGQPKSKVLKKQVQIEDPDPIQSKKLKQKALIDKIIENSPGVIKVREEQKFFAPDQKAKESLLENEHLVTETLAKIYALQGNISKALRSYEILSLKYPQKSAYFASLIKKLKNNQ